MCRAVACRRCGRTIWSGCGLHVDQVMRGVPADRRCTPTRTRGARWSGAAAATLSRGPLAASAGAAGPGAEDPSRRG